MNTGFEVYKRRNLVCNDLAKITNEKHTDEESTQQAKGTVTVKEQRSECLTRVLCPVQNVTIVRLEYRLSEAEGTR